MLFELKTKGGSQQLGDRRGSSRPESSANARSSRPGPSRSLPEAQKQDTDITSTFKAFNASQNKENRLPDQHKGSQVYPSSKDAERRPMYRKYPDATRVEWNEDSQGFLQTDDEEPTQRRNNKRKTPPSDDDLSSDPGFQNDQRNMAPPRRTIAPKPQARPNKRARTEAGESSRAQTSNSGDRPREVHSPIGLDDGDDDDDIQSQFASEQRSQQRRERSQQVARRPQQRRERSQSQQVARRSQPPSREQSSVILGGDEGSAELSDGDATPPISSTQTQAIARANVAIQASKTSPKKPQSRETWSDADTDTLLRLIKIYGTGWSLIEKLGRFERKVSQVSLKDKARNEVVKKLR
ncbi:hypothetical protein NHQ30_005993 [Ciborinia camelliae]|nr:hypothetical protein NHQ30_005993 [Ciborinia camelliae]